MLALGLDIATVTGLCLRTQAGSYQLEEWKFTPKAATKTRPKEPEGVRFRRLYDDLDAYLGEHPDVGVVVIEEGFSKSTRGWQVLGGLIAAVEIVLEKRELPYLFVNTSTLKAFARGKSTTVLKAFRRQQKGEKGAEKLAMCQVAGRVLGLGEITDNQADAWWLVKWWEENVTHVNLYGQGTLKL